MTIDASALLKMQKARIAMIMRQPFFGSLALRMRLIERTDLNPPTLATNGKDLFYHPAWVHANEKAIHMSGCGHEVGHCIFMHGARRGKRQPKKWNYAGDFVVNAMLKDAGFELGDGWLYDEQFKGMSAEQIYSLLPDFPPDEGQGEAGNQPFDEHPDFDVATDDMMEERWKSAIVQAAIAAKAAGKLPAGLARFVKELIHGRQDWRSVLRHFCTEVTKDDYSFVRPNRKMAAQGIYLPGLWSEGMGEMTAAIDTSGSITEEILRLFGGEITAIRDQLRPSEVRVIYCDTEVNHVDEFQQYDELEFNPHGGGGTSFDPPFDWLAERGLQPACFMYLTDGHGSFPRVPPPYPVLWLMTTDVIPPWGEHVRIDG